MFLQSHTSVVVINNLDFMSQSKTFSKYHIYVPDRPLNQFKISQAFRKQIPTTNITSTSSMRLQASLFSKLWSTVLSEVNLDVFLGLLKYFPLLL